MKNKLNSPVSWFMTRLVLEKLKGILAMYIINGRSYVFSLDCCFPVDMSGYDRYI